MSFLTVIENAFSPTIQEAVTFAHNIETDAETSETTDIAGAFTAAYTAWSASTDSFEEKALASITAFGSALLGYGIIVTKEAAEQTATNPQTPVS